MESEIAHFLAGYSGWVVSILLAIINLLLWSRLKRLEVKVEQVGLKVEKFEHEYLIKHSELKDLELKMEKQLHDAEMRIIDRINDVSVQLASHVNGSGRQQLERP